MLRLMSERPLHDEDKYPLQVIRKGIENGDVYLDHTKEVYERGRYHQINQYRLTPQGRQRNDQ